MGVHNLWPILAPVKKEECIESLRGKTLAVDLAIWLVESQVTGMKMMQGKVVKPHLRNLFFRVSNFLKMGVGLIFVIDGTAPEIKWEEMSRRNASRQGGAGRGGGWRGARGRGRGGRGGGGRSHFKSWLNECQELLELMGVPCVQSKGEAEAMCAALDSQRLVDGCMTEDGDAFLYGARTIYKNLNMATGKVDCYCMDDIEAELSLDRRRLVALSLLLGCDYLPKGVPGVGKELTTRFMKSLPRSVDVLKLFKDWTRGESPLCMSDGEKEVKRKALKVEGFPNQEVIKEFLNNKETPPPRKLEWKRPLLSYLQHFNLIKMEWPAEYTQEKVVPLMTLFDLTHVTPDPKDGLRPAVIVKLRVRQGVQCVEVKWHKPAEDKENDGDGDPYYTTIEDRDLFSQVHPGIIEEYLTAKESKKTGRGKKTKGKTRLQEDPTETHPEENTDNPPLDSSERASLMERIQLGPTSGSDVHGNKDSHSREAQTGQTGTRSEPLSNRLDRSDTETDLIVEKFTALSLNGRGGKPKRGRKTERRQAALQDEELLEETKKGQKAKKTPAEIGLHGERQDVGIERDYSRKLLKSCSGDGVSRDGLHHQGEERDGKATRQIERSQEASFGSKFNAGSSSIMESAVITPYSLSEDGAVEDLCLTEILPLFQRLQMQSLQGVKASSKTPVERKRDNVVPSEISRLATHITHSKSNSADVQQVDHKGTINKITEESRSRDEDDRTCRSNTADSVHTIAQRVEKEKPQKSTSALYSGVDKRKPREPEQVPIASPTKSRSGNCVYINRAQGRKIEGSKGEKPSTSKSAISIKQQEIPLDKLAPGTSHLSNGNLSSHEDNRVDDMIPQTNSSTAHDDKLDDDSCQVFSKGLDLDHNQHTKTEQPGTPCQIRTCATQVKSKPCEVIDLTDSPTSVPCAMGKFNSKSIVEKSGTQWTKEQSSYAYSTHSLETTQNSEKLSPGPNEDNSSEMSLIQKLQSIVSCNGKPLSNVMENDISFLKLDSGLASFLQNLSAVSSSWIDSAADVNERDDSVFIIDDDDKDEGADDTGGKEENLKVKARCKDDGKNVDHSAGEREEKDNGMDHAGDRTLEDLDKRTGKSVGDTQVGQERDYANSKNKGLHSDREKETNVELVPSKRRSKSQACASGNRKANSVKVIKRKAARLKKGKRTTQTKSLHDTVLLENSLARILEALSPAVSQSLAAKPRVEAHLPASLTLASLLPPGLSLHSPSTQQVSPPPRIQQRLSLMSTPPKQTSAASIPHLSKSPSSSPSHDFDTLQLSLSPQMCRLQNQFTQVQYPGTSANPHPPGILKAELRSLLSMLSPGSLPNVRGKQTPPPKPSRQCQAKAYHTVQNGSRSASQLGHSTICNRSVECFSNKSNSSSQPEASPTKEMQPKRVRKHRTCSQPTRVVSSPVVRTRTRSKRRTCSQPVRTTRGVSGGRKRRLSILEMESNLAKLLEDLSPV